MIETCQFCVMDNSVAKLNFDESGRCNACIEAEERLRVGCLPDERGQRLLEQLVLKLKQDGKGSDYDCMIGLSGGIDSAYLAHFAVVELGLRVLAIHVDGGWNSEPAVRNIENIVTKLGIDLHSVVIEWNEMRDLQVSFLKSGVINQDIPQDHAFFTSLHRAALKYGIKYFLSGVNLQTECVEVPSGGHTSLDGRHLKAVHEIYGRDKLNNFPISSFSGYLFRTKIARSVRMYKPLNWINYSKESALKLLKDEYDWVDYGTKHSESRFTKFYQDIYLPKRMNFDKRRLHLSSLIVSGEISRSDALRELEKPVISPLDTKREMKFMAKKLKISEPELNEYIAKPIVAHSEFKNDLWIQNLLLFLRSLKEKVLP